MQIAMPTVTIGNKIANLWEDRLLPVLTLNLIVHTLLFQHQDNRLFVKVYLIYKGINVNIQALVSFVKLEPVLAILQLPLRMPVKPGNLIVNG